MATPSFENLITPLTPDQVKTSIYQVLAAIGTNTTAWKPGAVARTIIAACAILIASLSELMALIAKSGFLELSEGAWLTITARYVFGVERIEATFAVGQVTLSNAGGGVYSFDPGDLVVIYSGKAKTYRNTTAFSLSAFQIGVIIDIEAIEVGADSSAGPGLIDRLETALIGVTVTNAISVIGLDAESDPALRLRCLEKLSALSPNAPRGAFEYFAKSARRADGQPIGVTRVRVSNYSDVGEVTVTVAGASGAILGTSGDPSTDLGAIAKAIDVNVNRDGDVVFIETATNLPVDVTYEAWIYSTASLTPSATEDAILKKLTAFMAGQPIKGNIIPPASGKVFQDAIKTAIGATRPEIFHVAVTVPSGDVAVGANQVPVLGTVSCTAIHVVIP